MLPSETVTELLGQILIQLSLIKGKGKHTDFWAIGKKQPVIVPLRVH